MKTIKVLHLYYDLMNLSGDSGNLTAIIEGLKKQNVKYTVDYLSINNKIKFNKYDIVYIGHGSAPNQEIVRKDILKYKKDINEYIKSGAYLIATGNSYELFGHSINDKKALGIFNFNTTEVDYKLPYNIALSHDNRLVSEVLYKIKGFEHPIIGFINHGNENNNKENILFDCIQGFGSNSKAKTEGIHKYHFYGTYVLGPLLIRNPYLLDKMIKDILDTNAIPYTDITNTTQYKAYNEYLNNFNIKEQ